MTHLFKLIDQEKFAKAEFKENMKAFMANINNLAARKTIFPVRKA